MRHVLRSFWGDDEAVRTEAGKKDARERVTTKRVVESILLRGGYRDRGPTRRAVLSFYPCPDTPVSSSVIDVPMV